MKEDVPSPYVRARDGSYYQAPAFTFPEGFAVFSVVDARFTCTLVLWTHPDQPSLEYFAPAGILRRVFHEGGVNLDTLQRGFSGEFLAPGEDPLIGTKRPGWAYVVEVVRRIPQPDAFADNQRYPGRIRGAQVIDLASSPQDRHEIQHG